MAQTIIGFYCFNDSDAATVRDFGINERHGTATNLAIGTNSNAVGKVGIFNGTSSVNFGNITALNSLTGFSIVTKLSPDTIGSIHMISYRNTHHTLKIDADGRVVFRIYNGAASWVELTHTRVLVAATWHTIIAIFDATNIHIYLDDDAVQSTAATGTLYSSSNSLYVGTDATSYLDGNMEMISYYSKVIDATEILAVKENPSGLKHEATDSRLQTGDLVLNNASGKEVVTWYEEFDERYFSDNEQHLWHDQEQAIWPN